MAGYQTGAVQVWVRRVEVRAGHCNNGLAIGRDTGLLRSGYFVTGQIQR